MHPRPRRPIRLLLLACAVVAALGMSACFKKQPYYTSGEEGAYVRAGQLTYQVQLSRELNRFGTEDREWLRGVAVPGPTKDETWFAVWMRVENTTGTPATSTTDFTIEDTAGRVYHPEPLTPSNPFRYVSQRVGPHETIPTADSAAGFDPTQGELLLFKLNLQSYQDRPLTLKIATTQPPGPKQSDVSLDL